MTTVMLTYFDLDASRGEECRLALHLAGVPFTDHRIVRAEWPAMKPTTPFGSLPLLTVEGKGVLAQSNAILGYIGRTWGLQPEDGFVAAQHEAVMCACEDLRASFNPAFRESDPARKAALRAEFAATTLQTWAGYIERQLKGPFLAGDTLYVADIKLYIVVRWFLSGTLDHVPTSCLDGHPALLAHQAAVASHPGVVAWTSRAR